MELCVRTGLKITPEYIFTKLKESEDERIKKDIIAHFKDDINELTILDSEDYEAEIEELKKYIAWLEKQGETFTKRDVDDAYLKGICDAKRELEKQGEQKPADKVEPKSKAGDWIVDNRTGIVHYIANIKGTVEKSWSNEDEKNWRGVIDEIEANKSSAPDYDVETYNRFLSWLKSIKDRIQPQPNQKIF